MQVALAAALSEEETVAWTRTSPGAQEEHPASEEGALPTVRVSSVAGGTRDAPGRGVACIGERVWETRDYQDRLPITEELAGNLPGCSVGASEDHQCVFINTAAAYLQQKSGTDPSVQEAARLAQSWRAAMCEDARRAEAAMGAPGAYVSLTEAEVRTFCHDVLHVSHDKDYRVLATFPPAALGRAAIHVVQVDPEGGARLEVITGAEYGHSTEGLELWMLLHKGHLQVLLAPNACSDELRRDFEGHRPLQAVAADGWAAYLRRAASKEAQVPGDAAHRCIQCRAAQQISQERKAGERMTQGEEPDGRPPGPGDRARRPKQPAWEADAPLQGGGRSPPPSHVQFLLHAEGIAPHREAAARLRRFAAGSPPGRAGAVGPRDS